MESEESGSDLEISRVVMAARKFAKPPKSPDEHLKKEPKKMTTKTMLESALKDLHTRKGVSLYAIKKYMVEKYNVDTDKINFYLKKALKTGIEKGDIIQTKGMGVSGSFKLAPKKKEEKKVKKKKEKQAKKMEKPTKKEKSTKGMDKSKKIEKTDKVKETEKSKKSSAKSDAKADGKNKSGKVKSGKEMENGKTKAGEKKVTIEKKTKKVAKQLTGKTPKKKSLAKRKSVGSIIKPPKMRPKMKE